VCGGGNFWCLLYPFFTKNLPHTHTHTHTQTQSFPHDLYEKTEFFLYIGQLIDLSPKIFAIYLIIQIPYQV